MHVVGVETGIHSANAIHVARKCSVFDSACIAQLCFKLVRAAQLVKCCNGRYHLHGRCGAHGLAFVKAVYGRVGIEVVNHQSQLRSAQHVGL